MSWHIPVKTPWMETQVDHKVTMDYAKDIYKVASKLKDFKALEIGSAWGVSTLAILEAGARYLMSVDNNALIKAPGEVEANGYKDKWAWNFIRSEQYWKENNDTFDLVYVDGSHLYVDVVNDLYEGWKRVNPGGLMLIDDWDHKKNIQAENDTTEYGVSLACFEFWRDHKVSDVGIEGRVLWFQK